MCRVSIAAYSQTCPVPSRCLLPAFVAVAQALRNRTSYNKHHKSSLLDAMALEFGFRRRSGNTPATQASRLLQLQAYYAYEDYFEHTLRAASVLTIRVPKVQPRAAVLDTGASCSASNNPDVILEILPSTVLLKPAVGPPQSMREVRMTIPTFDITGASLSAFRSTRSSCHSTGLTMNFGLTYLRGSPIRSRLQTQFSTAC